MQEEITRCFEEVVRTLMPDLPEAEVIGRILSKVDAKGLITEKKLGEDLSFVATGALARLFIRVATGYQLSFLVANEAQDLRRGIRKQMNFVCDALFGKATESKMPVFRTEMTQDALEVVEAFKDTLPSVQTVSEANMEQWKKTVESLMVNQKKSKEEILSVIRWARSDNFWRNNFLSLSKLLRKDKDGVSYYEIFLARVLSLKKNYKSDLFGEPTDGFY